jgi:hypothetical protein
VHVVWISERWTKWRYIVHWLSVFLSEGTSVSTSKPWCLYYFSILWGLKFVLFTKFVYVAMTSEIKVSCQLKWFNNGQNCLYGDNRLIKRSFLESNWLGSFKVNKIATCTQKWSKRIVAVQYCICIWPWYSFIADFVVKIVLRQIRQCLTSYQLQLLFLMEWDVGMITVQ